uniref:Uncharacterized protein n=1 Tax=Octopus bimaculoides TaxID=37653 RepID=A0A0L8IG12_OCTBM
MYWNCYYVMLYSNVLNVFCDVMYVKRKGYPTHGLRVVSSSPSYLPVLFFVTCSSRSFIIGRGDRG